jgi:hypothetical protein
MAAGLYEAGLRTWRPDLVMVRGTGGVVVLVVVVGVLPGGEGSDEVIEERPDVRLVLSSSSSPSWVFVRLRVPTGPRGPVGVFIFVILVSDEPIFRVAALASVGLDDAVSPAVTFLIALMPAVE